MKLAIFDIDGTLIDTNKVDGDCFAQALLIEFGIANINMNWTEYLHATDSSITQEIFQQAFVRNPKPEEIQRFVKRFVSLLKESYLSNPECFREILGSRLLLQRLSNNSDWKIGMATGGWFASSVYKLNCAGIHFEGIPFTAADDAISREDVVLKCITKAQVHYGIDKFSKIVSIGDAVWDIQTAKSLKLPFIGVGDKDHLTRLGVTHIIQNYSDLSHFIQLLEMVE
jgi:phosphoglycolate phosphatase-like HAD superfamily hydrolase